MGRADAERGSLGASVARGPLTLVLDANVVVGTLSAVDGFASYVDDDPVAPPLMWSEARSTIREAAWRGDLQRVVADELARRLEAAPVARRAPRDLGHAAWRIADELGWAKTYDAEYVALAQLLGCRLVTLDGRLRRGADRLGFVVSPTEL